MASLIRALTDKVANQIAAGEVVERPASVVKELVENSIDAGAQQIIVAIRNGGKSHIEVTDDGDGMGRDDAIMAFERHATSKIINESDLRSIDTLGFRGEALPSIASVSRLTLWTSRSGASAGTEVHFDGGVLNSVKECAPIKGTRVFVDSLFYNTPARRKFLRSENVEAGHVRDTVIRQALGSPGVGFRFVRDGKPLFDAAPVEGDGDTFMDRVSALFGKDIADELTPVRFNHAGMGVEGYVSRPGVSYAGREKQFTFINNRFVRDRLAYHAIMEGHRSLLPKGRYPAIFLRLTIPADRVDVNVSPTKTEVRFVDGGALFHLVKSGVIDALERTRLRHKEGGDDHQNENDAERFASTGVSLKTESSFWAPPVPSQHSGLNELREPMAAIAPYNETAPTRFDESGETEPELKHFDSVISEGFKPVGQIFGAFILLEEGDRLLLLDQHTTHERINYEKLSVKYREGKVDSQELLFPMQMDLSGEDSDRVRDNLAAFEKLGFVIEEFGERTFSLRSVPALLIGKDYKALILDILSKMGKVERADDFSEISESAINIMACRSAVKAGQKLDRREIESLVEGLKLCKLPYTCPHGRPIALTLEKEDLLKGFLRK